MKPIIFKDGVDKVEVGLSFFNSFVTITKCAGAVSINTYSIDKLIETLYLVKKELEDVK